ncbi:MAG: AAA family ATPase [Treponema succinifaciens]|uniref:ATP-binding protein n=3 Tax=Treponema succinifaciens TaxID=167 RepID=UPI0023530773|nr:AAA family ATPase [Treponema succinifaciens]MCI6913506.1 AAA family ATPase [Treponema succinifaciens]
MYFKRKAYQKLLEWKKNYSSEYAVMLEGARRVGKSTIAENFAKNEYKSHILIDFSKSSANILECFDDIGNPDVFFLRLQAETGTTLYEHESLIIFDEVQLFPKARQAIKHLVADGRYSYLETGSLISIRKNVKDILIPSEEMKIQVFPMDYEEFCDATGGNFELLRQIFGSKRAIGQATNRKLMRDLRVYMAVGGMPQAVEAYINGKNFSEIDMIKRQIISLYEEDFKKIDPSGRISALYHAVPAQLAKDARKYRITTAIGKRNNTKADELLYELIDSKTVLPCYNSTDPRASLADTKDFSSYKLYLSDTGLFVTLMFIDRPATENKVYAKLLSDKLPANLGYLYENLAAQMIAASGRKLYYHTWEKSGSTHYYEVDFLIPDGSKIDALEIKSSGTGKHESIKEFCRKFSQNINRAYLISQKDSGNEENLLLKPFYLVPFLTE